MSVRISGAARSIRVASRQRRFRVSGWERDQNGFTSSSIWSTVLPQSVLRNLNFPVSPMTLSYGVAVLKRNSQGLAPFRPRAVRDPYLPIVFGVGQPHLPPLVNDSVAAASLDPFQPDQAVSGLHGVPSEPAVPLLTMQGLLPQPHTQPSGPVGSAEPMP